MANILNIVDQSVVRKFWPIRFFTEPRPHLSSSGFVAAGSPGRSISPWVTTSPGRHRASFGEVNDVGWTYHPEMAHGNVRKSPYSWYTSSNDMEHLYQSYATNPWRASGETALKSHEHCHKHISFQIPAISPCLLAKSPLNPIKLAWNLSNPTKISSSPPSPWPLRRRKCRRKDIWNTPRQGGILRKGVKSWGIPSNNQTWQWKNQHLPSSSMFFPSDFHVDVWLPEDSQKVLLFTPRGRRRESKTEADIIQKAQPRRFTESTAWG